MHREKSIAHHKYRIATSSSISNDDKNLSLGANKKEAPKAHASTHNAAFSSAMLQRRGRVGSFTVEFIHPQVQGIVEGRPFNVI